MTPLQQDDIILQAALQFGPDYLYTIKNGSLGTTLYIHVGKKEEGKNHLKYLLEGDIIPIAERERLENNLKTYDN